MLKGDIEQMLETNASGLQFAGVILVHVRRGALTPVEAADCVFLSPPPSALPTDIGDRMAIPNSAKFRMAIDLSGLRFDFARIVFTPISFPKVHDRLEVLR